MARLQDSGAPSLDPAAVLARHGTAGAEAPPPGRGWKCRRERRSQPRGAAACADGGGHATPVGERSRSPLAAFVAFPAPTPARGWSERERQRGCHPYGTDVSARVERVRGQPGWDGHLPGPRKLRALRGMRRRWGKAFIPIGCLCPSPCTPPPQRAMQRWWGNVSISLKVPLAASAHRRLRAGGARSRTARLGWPPAEAPKAKRVEGDVWFPYRRT